MYVGTTLPIALHRWNDTFMFARRCYLPSFSFDNYGISKKMHRNKMDFTFISYASSLQLITFFMVASNLPIVQ